MAMERRNPLPVGRYWHDVVALPSKPAARADFADWLSRNTATVHVEVTTDHPDDEPPSSFYIFAVSQPTAWEGPGYPTIAPASIKSQTDTVQRPAPSPSIADQVEQITKSAGEGVVTGLKVIAVLGGIALVVWLLTKKGNAAGL